MALMDRRTHHDEIDLALEAWTKQYTNVEATEILQNRSIAAGPVNTTPDITQDEQVSAREFYIPYEKFGTPMPGNAIQMDGIDRTLWTPCPKLGGENREILQTWLNLGNEEIDYLQEKKFIFDSPPT